MLEADTLLFGDILEILFLDHKHSVFNLILSLEISTSDIIIEVHIRGLWHEN